jgi:hypothetical protein
MKRSIIIIFSIMVSLVSCTGELDNEPIGLLTEDQVDGGVALSTIESSVTSTYIPLSNTLQGVVSGWRWDLGAVFRNDIVLQDIASNDMSKKWALDGDQAWMDRVGLFSFSTINEAFNGIWIYDFEGINRANTAIGFLNSEDTQAVGLDSARKNQLLSEAHFLRAYYYFDLVNNFGDVPLLSEQPNSFEEALAAALRAPKADVLALVNSDLELAKSLATDAKYSDVADPWRVSKGAIIAMQAKIALFNEEWNSVLALISELDGLGHYSLNAEYFDNFDINMEYAENEVIFAYNHTSNAEPDNSNGIGAMTGWGFYKPTPGFEAAFEANDPRWLYTSSPQSADVGSYKLLGSTTTIPDNGNKVYIRYADVLLWKAEALIQTGDLSGAIAIINQIRNRARTSSTVDGSAIPAGTLPDRPSSANQSEVMGWLMHERRVELGFESHRFNDLKRWGTAQSELTALGVPYQDYHNLFPIPQRDIDKSGGTITQNPGY